MGSNYRRRLAQLALGLALALVIGAFALPSAHRRAGSSEGTVSRVYDGDTIEVVGVGKVRLLGIDAMDAHNEARARRQAERYGLPLARVRHWSAEATDFVRERLLGRRVELSGGRGAVDDYGRVLAYVGVSDAREGQRVDLNRLLVERGLAAAYRSYEHSRRARYLRAERDAREEGRGLWQDVR